MSTTPTYRHGLGVPCLERVLELQVPARIDFGMIDALLHDLLDVTSAEIGAVQWATPSAPTHSAAPSPADCVPLVVHAYLQRLLLANAALLRIGLVPCFEPGRVVQVAPLAGKQDVFQARLALQYFEHMAVEHLHRSLELAESLVRRAAAPTDRPLDRTALDRAVQQQIIRPLQLEGCGGVSTLPILRAATALKIPVRHLGYGVYQFGQGARSRKMSRSALDTDSAIGSEASVRKDRTVTLLAAAGLPVPTHRLVDKPEAALQAAMAIGYPVVVKPADRERSEGVSVGIGDAAALQTAFQVARKLSARVLVERQIAGVCHRLMVADGRFLYAVERGPRALEGDGEHDVAWLLAADAARNQAAMSWQRRKVVTADAETLAVLAAHGHDLGSVPAKGARVPLRAIESTEWSETTIDVTDRIHPANVVLAERAARALGLCNAGIDLITTDIARPWWEAGGVVTEINFRPHFGGTTAARARMASFLDRILPGGGRIPIEVFVGGATVLQAAQQRHTECLAAGTRAWVCAAGQAYGPQGAHHLALREPGLLGICRALLADREVEALLVVVQDDEFLRTGFPFDRINRLDVEAALLSAADSTAGQPGALAQLVAALRRMLP